MLSFLTTCTPCPQPEGQPGCAPSCCASWQAGQACLRSVLCTPACCPQPGSMPAASWLCLLPCSCLPLALACSCLPAASCPCSLALEPQALRAPPQATPDLAIGQYPCLGVQAPPPPAACSSPTTSPTSCWIWLPSGGGSYGRRRRRGVGSSGCGGGWTACRAWPRPAQRQQGQRRGLGPGPRHHPSQQLARALRLSGAKDLEEGKGVAAMARLRQPIPQFSLTSCCSPGMLASRRTLVRVSRAALDPCLLGGGQVGLRGGGRMRARCTVLQCDPARSLPACLSPCGSEALGGSFVPPLRPSPHQLPALETHGHWPPLAVPVLRPRQRLCPLPAAAPLLKKAGWRLEFATTRARIGQEVARMLGASDPQDVCAFQTQPDVGEDRYATFVVARR